jgi:ribosome-associated heat shock protein Hsp15
VAGGVRVNGTRTEKAATTVRAGDVLTFVQADRVRVVEVLGFAARRGAASEAQTLYRDLEPPADSALVARAGPRPSGRDRRAIERLRRPSP